MRVLTRISKRMQIVLCASHCLAYLEWEPDLSVRVCELLLASTLLRKEGKGLLSTGSEMAVGRCDALMEPCLPRGSGTAANNFARLCKPAWVSKPSACSLLRAGRTHWRAIHSMRGNSLRQDLMDIAIFSLVRSLSQQSFTSPGTDCASWLFY